MAKRILVTGLGIITSIGDNAEQNLASLVEGRAGIGKITLLETVHRASLPAGEIRHTDEQLAAMAGVGPEDGLTRTALLGMIAAAEAVRSAGLTTSPPGPLSSRRGGMESRGVRTGLISGCTVGGMVSTEKYYLDYLENDTRNAWIAANECSDSTERIAGLLGIGGFVSTINTACSSSANAIMTGARMIRAGLLDRVLVGGTDALSMFTINGFHTLMIYSREACRPFDQQRNGLNLGEGAAYLLLESEEATGSRRVLCEISGYGNSTDAFHQTALSPEGKGPFLAMRQALISSGLSAGQIDYVNAHGTATINNDLSEGMAIMRLFGEQVPPVSSTKAFTGHLLGASGAVEAVYSALSIMHGMKWANLNFRERMEEMNFEPIPRLITGVPVNHVLSNSFGFGGNNTSLIFSTG